MVVLPKLQYLAVRLLSKPHSISHHDAVAAVYQERVARFPANLVPPASIAPKPTAAFGTSPRRVWCG